MGTKISNKVYNSLSSKLIHRKTAKGMQVHGGSRVSKETRETSEGVLDQRTRKVIMSFINQEVLEKMGGVLATGKEASAYAAYGVGKPLPSDDHVKAAKATPTTPTTPTTSTAPTTLTRSPPRHLVVKFFRTTLSQFKNRADYVDGDSRYNGAKFSKIKTTDALKMWAAKEFRNLIRLHRVGVQCPEPLHVSGHTLVMTMISKDSNGVPAPQLKEVQLSTQRLRHVFTHVAVNMRAMFQRAKLVHGDLSEFNILYVGGKERPVVLIDVGQAVDLSHPKHIEYLGRDCRTVLDFFQRRSAKLGISFGLPSVEELLMYVVSDEEEEKEMFSDKSFDEIDVLALKRIKRRLKR
jgi:serine/threonine-protein kinase RIO1